MGKKVKVGKQRRDKAYWAAKEIGYRSRASFKLVQLNRKWEFLQKSNVCIDLCAAPGSWMQVCRENMPISSLVVGVDLAPIKPLPNCIALQEDITTEKCKASLRKELKTAKADLVLHDGAPNVGKNWIHDAYQQSLLTLSAFKLATCFLTRGGWFVTKVFRSKDYQSLIWVFSQFFKKVHATKPAASRNESAEIFVVCQYYLAPDKIDPKFLDAKYVFSDIETENRRLTAEIINPEKAKKKPISEGYAEGVTLLYKEAKASEFITGDDPVRMLNASNRIVIDKPWIKNHVKTSKEIVECLKDLKVLGMKDLRVLKKWRDALRKDLEKKTEEENEGGEEAGENAGEAEKTEDQIEDEELDDIDKQVAELEDAERRKEKRKKKKEKKEQDKRVQRLNLKMIIPGDEGPRAEEHGLFQVSDLRSGKDLDKVLDSKPDEVAEHSDDDLGTMVKHRKFERFDRGSGGRDSEGTWYEEHDDVIQDSSDEEYEHEEQEKEHLDLKPEQDDDEPMEDNPTVEDEDPTASNPLLTRLSKETPEERRARKAALWFTKIGDLEEDSDLEDAEMERAVTRVQDKGGKFRQKEKTEESGYTSGSESEEDETDTKTKSQPLDLPRSKDSDSSDASDSDSDSDSDDYDSGRTGVGPAPKVDAGGFEIVPQQQVKKRKALSAEQLTLGEELVKSKKSKRDIMDAGWNRYMFNDTGLPEWFTKDEEVHYKRRVELDPETLQKYKEREKELNVKTIKKVVEAKARRKQRVAKKMEKAKKKAAALLENSDVGSHEKAREIKKMYRQAAAEGKKKDVKYVVAKKHHAAKRASRPAGTKGPYKQVDPRMKKDTKGKRDNATKKRGQKRRLKGKQAKPTKQFNTNR
eukprot:TRINITY_DN425_c0_g1_i10.p1 TRINITY_DN425_c0_g1~~TRINITY_DN425_c0_g1_i10.p1  ORF type:complete len:864 (-),score=336.42 TRINITY_DN425_c0_g1_i10:76-2667(-)